MSGLAIVDFREDWHVHSRFSDGAGTLEENISAAERAGLRKLGCVDHVRSSSTWMPEMAQALDALRPSTDVVLSAGVETKLLDVAGALDLPAPELLEGIDRIVIADHQVPSPEGPRDPKEVREAIAGGDLDPAVAAGWIIDSTSRALELNPGALIAHLFSVLPKAGIPEATVGTDGLARLIEAAAESGAVLEISERWQTPSGAIARAFQSAGVQVVASTDSHRPEDIGQYTFARRAAESVLASQGQDGA